MKNFNMTFEEYLQEEFSKENPVVLDDYLPDAFNDWLGELQADNFIEYGDMYGQELLKINSK